MTSRAFDLGPLALYFVSAKLSHFKRFRQELVPLNLIAQCKGGGERVRAPNNTPPLSLPLAHLQQPRFEHKHIAEVGSAVGRSAEEEQV